MDRRFLSRDIGQRKLIVTGPVDVFFGWGLALKGKILPGWIEQRLTD